MVFDHVKFTHCYTRTRTPSDDTHSLAHSRKHTFNIYIWTCLCVSVCVAVQIKYEWPVHKSSELYSNGLKYLFGAFLFCWCWCLCCPCCDCSFCVFNGAFFIWFCFYLPLNLSGTHIFVHCDNNSSEGANELMQLFRRQPLASQLTNVHCPLSSEQCTPFDKMPYTVAMLLLMLELAAQFLEMVFIECRKNCSMRLAYCFVHSIRLFASDLLYKIQL